MLGARQGGVMDQNGDQGLSSVFRGQGQAHPRDGGLCLAGTGSLSVSPWEDPTARSPTWDTWGNFSDWLVPRLQQPAPRSSRRDEGADPACGRVGVCMSVDTERHTLTHTHSHARTHSRPSAASPASPPTFVPKQAGFSGPLFRCRLLATQREQGSRRSGPRPPGKGWGEGAPCSYRLAAECAPEPRVPPRHVGRTGGDAAAGEGPAELPRPGPPAYAWPGPTAT